MITESDPAGEEWVILIDENDRPVGTCEKLAAHTEARLHRAFSVFIFNPAGELLLQQRAASKYHSGGLWSNTCCGHPRPGERTHEAAARRLQEEMGFVAPLEHALVLSYELGVGAGLYEHEYNHVFVGEFTGAPRPAPEEVQAWRWASMDEVLTDLRSSGETYAAWFGLALDKLLERSRGDNG